VSCPPKCERTVAAAWEAAAEGADLATGDEHYVGALVPNDFGALGAVGEEREQPVGGKVDGERGEPDLQAGVGGVPGGDAEPFGIAAGDAHGVAVQLTGDHRHVVPGRIGSEDLPGNLVTGKQPVS